MELNKIVTDSRGLKSSIKISTELMKSMINFLTDLEGSFTVELHDMSGNICILLNNLDDSASNRIIMENISKVDAVKQLMVNGDIIISREITPDINGICRDFQVFRQTNNKILDGGLYAKVIEELEGTHLVSIGGECYIHPKIFQDYFTDFVVLSHHDNIVEHAEINRIDKPTIIQKVSFEEEDLCSYFTNCDTIILNVRSILPCHLRTITRSSPTKVIVISCKSNNIEKLQSITNSMKVVNIANIQLITFTT